MNMYEFALVRYVHDITAGEFVNVGVVLFDRTDRKLHFKATSRYRRVSEFFGGIDGTSFNRLTRHLEAFLQRQSSILEAPGLLDELPNSLQAVLAPANLSGDDRFQLSAIMTGVSTSPANDLVELYEEFVQRYELGSLRNQRTESEIGKELVEQVVHARLGEKVSFNYPVQSADYSYSFHMKWQNGITQLLDPISFDLVDANRIVEKASQWTGRLYSLQSAGQFAFTGLVAPPSDPTKTVAFERALRILRGAPRVRDVIVERESERLMETIRNDTASPSPYRS